MIKLCLLWVYINYRGLSKVSAEGKWRLLVVVSLSIGRRGKQYSPQVVKLAKLTFVANIFATSIITTTIYHHHTYTYKYNLT